MKVLFDTNILLDVFQNRQPHYETSAACVNEVLKKSIEALSQHMHYRAYLTGSVTLEPVRYCG